MIPKSPLYNNASGPPGYGWALSPANESGYVVVSHNFNSKIKQGKDATPVSKQFQFGRTPVKPAFAHPPPAIGLRPFFRSGTKPSHTPLFSRRGDFGKLDHDDTEQDFQCDLPFENQDQDPSPQSPPSLCSRFQHHLPADPTFSSSERERRLSNGPYERVHPQQTLQLFQEQCASGARSEQISVRTAPSSQQQRKGTTTASKDCDLIGNAMSQWGLFLGGGDRSGRSAASSKSAASKTQSHSRRMAMFFEDGHEEDHQESDDGGSDFLDEEEEGEEEYSQKLSQASSFLLENRNQTLLASVSSLFEAKPSKPLENSTRASELKKLSSAKDEISNSNDRENFNDVNCFAAATTQGKKREPFAVPNLAEAKKRAVQDLSAASASVPTQRNTDAERKIISSEIALSSPSSPVSPSGSPLSISVLPMAPRKNGGPSALTIPSNTGINESEAQHLTVAETSSSTTRGNCSPTRALSSAQLKIETTEAASQVTTSIVKVEHTPSTSPQAQDKTLAPPMPQTQIPHNSQIGCFRVLAQQDKADGFLFNDHHRELKV